MEKQTKREKNGENIHSDSDSWAYNRRLCLRCVMKMGVEGTRKEAKEEQKGILFVCSVFLSPKNFVFPGK